MSSLFCVLIDEIFFNLISSFRSWLFGDVGMTEPGFLGHSDGYLSEFGELWLVGGGFFSLMIVVIFLVGGSGNLSFHIKIYN